MGAGELEAGIWQARFKIHSYEVDYRRRATLESLCRRFLDSAWNHAEALDVGFSQLAQQQKFWVLSRLLVNIHRYPAWGETVILNTWPRPVESLFALRHFEVLDEPGRQLVGGVSAWLVLDARTRRPQRLEKVLTTIRVFPEKRALLEDPGKLPACEARLPSLTTSVRYSDIDVNRHVNSARYVGWLVDAYEPGFQDDRAVSRLEVNYLAETLSGEMISVFSQQIGSEAYLHLIAKNGGPEVCRARLEWRREPAATGSGERPRA